MICRDQPPEPVPEPPLELSAPPLEPVPELALEPPLAPLPKVEPLLDEGLELDMPLLELLGDELLGETLLLLELPCRDRQSVFAVPVRRSQSEFWLSVPVLESLLPTLELPVLEPLPMLDVPLPVLEPLPMLELPLPMLLPVEPVLGVLGLLLMPLLDEPLPMLLPLLLPCAPAVCASVNPIAAAPGAAARVFSFMNLLLAI